MKIPAQPPAIDLLKVFDGSLAVLTRAMARVNVATDRYLPWERLRFRTPPAGLTSLQWWAATKIQRQAQRRELPLRDLGGGSFSYVLPDEVLRLVTQVASKAGGNIGMAEPVTDPAMRDTYVVRSLMEESITSSQLEGAVTTRRVAKEMLRSGRDPRDKSELMIWNNYQAMLFILGHREAPLTPDFVGELHSIVTRGTLEHPEDGGRIQTPQDDRIHVGTPDGEVLHAPPPAEELQQRLQELCSFANSEGEQGPWLHPVLRSIAVHFMVGHDHYFVDGNGRLARALFYWSMLRQGLWLTEFVTISAILKNAQTKYAHSYLETEYESDLTYFFGYHLQVLDRAFDDLEAYLREKIADRRAVKTLLRGRYEDFNHRQVALIDNALSNPAAHYTAQSHANSHHVTIETARQDLIGLTAAGVLVRGKRGRAFVWRPAPGAREMLEL
ncbi:MAG: Fic family protein [Propionicimonas sp.]